MWSLQSLVLISFVIYSFVLQGPLLRGVGAAPVDVQDKITFHVYSAKNGTGYEADRDSQSSLDIEPNYPLTLIIHGFSGSHLGKSIRLMRDALLHKGLKNVVTVDWAQLATIPDVSVTVSYFQIVEENLPIVAKEITSWLKSLHEKKLIDYSEVHIIGFSLGGQVAGLVGSYLEGEIGRITALDPPKIGFAEKSLNDKIDTTDAKFLFVMHTSGGFISYSEPIGHVDFFPNGGLVPQPECPIDDMVHSMACSHYISYKLFTESIYNEQAFEGTKCGDYVTFLKGECDKNKHAVMGYATKKVTSGSFYIKTNSKPPFGQTVQGSPIPKNVLDSLTYSEEDIKDIAAQFLESDNDKSKEADDDVDISDKDKYDTIITDTSTHAVEPVKSIMKVSSKPHENHEPTDKPFRNDNNSSERCYHSHILIFFSLAFSLRFWRL